MTDKQNFGKDINVPNTTIIDGEHDMNYCEDNNCKYYGNKEQCEKTHCYYRCYSKLYTKLKAKEKELETICKAFDIEYAIDEETGSLIGRSNKLQEKEQELEEAKVKNVAYEAAAKDMRDHIKFIDETNRILYDEKVELLNKLEHLENEYEGFAVKYTDMEIALHNREQECEELKEQLERADEDIKMKCTRCAMTNQLDEQLDQLKAELTRANCQIADDEILQCNMGETIEELKASLDEKNKFLEQLGISASGEFHRIKYHIGKLVAKNDKLKQTLNEIKEIVSSTLDCGEWVGQGDNKMEQILNKISEVIND